MVGSETEFWRNMEHEGKALAADELADGNQPVNAVASVHIRALVTWLAIFPMVAIGMSALSALTPDWPPILKSLALTAVVVPLAVYVVVPRLLLAYGKIRRAQRAAR
jgi:antibiotic biosynthesis monooxygenase (ABM) superfamily enzyme